MKLLDYLIVAAVLLIIAGGIVLNRKRKCRCSLGDCSSCGKNLRK